MGCKNCRNWKCEEMTYGELEENWELSIGGMVTPGHRKRFEREAEAKAIPFEDTLLRYKHCSRGILTRFYIMKSRKDTKALVPSKDCSAFQSEGDVTVQIPSPLWSACTTESHGPSEVMGIPFTVGLYERGIYFRVPLCGSVKPIVSKRKIQLSLSFDTNDEYLRWWGKLYPDEFKKLNRRP